MGKDKTSRQQWMLKRQEEKENGETSSKEPSYSMRPLRLAPLCFMLVISVSVCLMGDFRTQRKAMMQMMANKHSAARNSTNSSTIRTPSLVQIMDTPTQASTVIQPQHNTSPVHKPENPPNISYSYLDHGAFVHLGKTGGSTLSLLLRNGCHSFVRKPCPTRNKLVDSPNETVASQKVTHYYHVPDFPKLPTNPTHPFYILTMRDPFDRTRSAFVYAHPVNMEATKRKFNQWRPLMKKYYNNSMESMTKCFPTLEGFVQNLGDGDQVSNFSYPERQTYPQEMHQENCQDFARAAMNQKVPALAHLYYNTNHIHRFMAEHLQNPKTVLFVTRQEHLMDDWVTVNKLLGQSKPIHIPSSRTRDISNVVLPVPNELSPASRVELCKALRQEYKDYIHFLQEAVNLGLQDVEEAKALALKNCPMLEFP